MRRLDLTRELGALQEADLHVEVVGCATDSLVTPAHSRTMAELLGADYRELDVCGGHMWMLTAWPTFARLFCASE